MLRKKRRKPLLTFNKTNKLLHSFNHKSTYFYKQQWFSTYSIPLASTLGLLLVLGLCISPLMPSSEEAYADTTSLADASIKLTVGNTNLAKQDAKAGEVNYITTTVNVNATNVDGYKVYVQAAPGNSAILRNGNTEITGVGSNVATTDFDSNKWGYALDSTGANVESLSYTSVPENSATLNPAYTTNAVSEDKNFNLAFAAKFGSDATAGHYSTNVLLSTVASAKDVAIFDEPTGFTSGSTTIYNMQDMTGTICSNAANGTTGRLRDTRDMKVYWVTKINDTCWMTQNLDLDLDENVNLTSADTDVTHAVTLPSTNTGATGFTNDANAAQSFDPGYYVYTPISATAACSNVDLTKCNGWLNILNGIWEASADPNFDKTVDDATGTYNAHYLVGNYYSYAAATAGSGPSAAGVASESICPKGWRLPSGGSNTGELYGIFNGMTLDDITRSPWYFVYNGYVSGSAMSNVGNQGTYRSSTNNNTTSAYILAFYSNVDTSYSTNHSYGSSVRCVAKDSKKLTDLIYMQDMTTGVCINSVEGESRKLIDRRDSKSYQVTKLKDNNCWMTENLNIVNKTIDPTYSDMTSGSFTVPASSLGGFSSSQSVKPQVYSDNTYGGYYNWYTVSVGQSASFNSATSFPTQATQSICPKKWRLPTGGTNSEYTRLFGGLTVDQALDIPYNFTYSGLIGNGALGNDGTLGYLWSSTAYSTSVAYSALVISSSLNGEYTRDLWNGMVVRCVAR